MTDNSGAVQALYAFDPFGNTIKLEGSADADYRYATLYMHHRSGLQLALHRAYSPSISRFLNRDPKGESGGANLFAYVANNPINANDPSGLDDISSLEAALKNVCNKECCGVEDKSACAADATKIARALNRFIFRAMQIKGPHTSQDAVNGYMCWDWASALTNEIANSGQSGWGTQYRFFASQPNEAGYAPVHFAVTLTPDGSKGGADCSVTVDDAFGHGFGEGNVHRGSFGAPGFSEYQGLFAPDPDTMSGTGGLVPVPMGPAPQHEGR